MGVQDFRFFVTPVPETTGDSSISKTDPPPPPSFKPPSRPISFQNLVQLQSKKLSAGSHLNRPGPTSLTSHRSEPNLTEHARSQMKSISISSGSTSNPGADHGEQRPKTAQSSQVELSEPSRQIQQNRPRNPIAAQFDVDSYSPVGLPTDRSVVANDLSTDLFTLSPFQNEETGPSDGPKLHESQGANRDDLSAAPAVTFSEILTHRDAIRRKLVTSGDPFCGKSSLCS
jgi:hypothetical protein